MIATVSIQNGADLGAPGDKTHRPTTPSEIFFRIFYLGAHAWLVLGEEWIPEGVVGRWVLSLNNLDLLSLDGDLLYSSPGALGYYPREFPKTQVEG